MTALPESLRPAQEALRRLRAQGVLAPLDDPVAIASILTGQADAYASVCAERDELRERIRAIRQTVFPHLREKTQRGDLAREIEAEADPHPEPHVA